jgi:fatty-acyl-CoA synthase
VREATIVAPPVFHGTGLMLSLLSIGLGSRLVLRRRFDATVLLDDIERHRVTTICVVPIMLQRILAVDDGVERDTGSLKAIFCAGSQLPGEVATRTLDRFGDVLYNLYGSTEVSVATLATPADLQDDPTCVGRPALGAKVRIFDEDGKPVPQGEVGTIYVGAVSPFEGYTGGGGKPVLDGLMASGDVGHFDAAGRLHIDGRDDEMIVSGGENVFSARGRGGSLLASGGR